MTCSKHIRLSLVECLFAYFQSTTNPGPQRPRLLTVPWEMEMDGGKKNIPYWETLTLKILCLTAAFQQGPHYVISAAQPVLFLTCFLMHRLSFGISFMYDLIFTFFCYDTGYFFFICQVWSKPVEEKGSGQLTHLHSQCHFTCMPVCLPASLSDTILIRGTVKSSRPDLNKLTHSAVRMCT